MLEVKRCIGAHTEKIREQKFDPSSLAEKSRHAGLKILRD